MAGSSCQPCLASYPPQLWSRRRQRLHPYVRWSGHLLNQRPLHHTVIAALALFAERPQPEARTPSDLDANRHVNRRAEPASAVHKVRFAHAACPYTKSSRSAYAGRELF